MKIMADYSVVFRFHIYLCVCFMPIIKLHKNGNVCVCVDCNMFVGDSGEPYSSSLNWC